MSDPLRTLMAAIEHHPKALPPTENPVLLAAALAGLGSKYLAVGSPATLGLIGCGPYSDALIACHTLLFGTLEVQRSEDIGIEEAMAADIVCISSSTEFELAWIADATHINVLSDGTWSKGMHELATTTSLTLSAPNPEFPAPYGLLAEVIQGVVSGRIGEEITVLMCMASLTILSSTDELTIAHDGGK